MKTTIFKSALLAAVVSLTFTPIVWAHDMGEANNENIDFVDDQINDNHTDRIEELMEDDALMGVTYQGTGAEESTTAMGDGANAVDTTAQSAAQTDARSITAVGRGSTSTMRAAGPGR
jgi:hypothetical protein